MKSIRPTIILLTVLALALPVPASDEMTVGNFVRRLARSKNLKAADARIAVDSLHEAGIRLPSDLALSTRLTEGDVARIARALGLAVSTNRPDAGFSSEQVDLFFASFRVELTLAVDGGAGNSARGNGDGSPFNPYMKGKGGSKGKKKGHDFRPAEPE
ncbi:MAG: hypothetical protein E2P01_06905 [Acidobacteria bacterium]|nr:MAG: hypothetical protein E2P01_06905 [Acidobacteriota bacterium]